MINYIKNQVLFKRFESFSASKSGAWATAVQIVLGDGMKKSLYLKKPVYN